MNHLTSYYLQVAFIAFIIIDHMTEIYLLRRQLETFHEHRSHVPDEFQAFLTMEDHQKAIAYSSHKIHFAQAHLVWDAVLLLAWFPFRGAEKLYLSLPEWGTHKEVLFLVLFTLIQMALNLPWAIFSTFVLEEKYGFNRTTPKIFIQDRVKGLLLGSLLAVPLLYLVLFLYQKTGPGWWLYSFALVTIFQLFLVWLYPTYIAPLFNKFHPLEQNDLRQGIENLVTRAGFKAAGIFVMDASKRSSHGNAYFTGFGHSKRVVFFDTLLSGLKKEEVLAILAHELGHLKLKHILKSLGTGILFSLLGFALMGKLSTETWFYTGHFVRVHSPAMLILLFTQAVPLYTFWFTPFRSWISRKREFEADEYAAKETQSEDLVSGLLKLYQQNASPVVSDKIYSFFYHSHPPALERIKRLRSFERKPGE